MRNFRVVVSMLGGQLVLEIKKQKGGKGGNHRRSEKNCDKDKIPPKTAAPTQALTEKQNGPRKGTWVRIMQKPNPTQSMDCMFKEAAPKRKGSDQPKDAVSLRST